MLYLMEGCGAIEDPVIQKIFTHLRSNSTLHASVMVLTAEELRQAAELESNTGESIQFIAVAVAMSKMKLKLVASIKLGAYWPGESQGPMPM